jgi:hypothetical protein
VLVERKSSRRRAAETGAVRPLSAKRLDPRAI